MNTLERIKEKLHKLPITSGVYLMKDIDGHIIYVGKAKNLKKRVSQYFLRKQEHVKVSVTGKPHYFLNVTTRNCWKRYSAWQRKSSKSFTATE